MKKHLLKCLLLPSLIACGDIVIQPSGFAGNDAPSQVDVDAGGGVTTLGEDLPITCPSFEPENSNILVYIDGGSFTSASKAGPTTGATECSGSGGACEYGASADRLCNHVYSCKNDTWTAQANSEGCYDRVCPSVTQMIVAIDGKDCDLGTAADPYAEAICDVADGTCACTTGSGNDALHKRVWACTKTPANCPPHRPRIGTTCNADQLFCDYGSCKSKRGTAVICQDNQWLETSTTCQ